jgi:hypothetical protein
VASRVGGVCPRSNRDASLQCGGIFWREVHQPQENAFDQKRLIDVSIIQLIQLGNDYGSHFRKFLNGIVLTLILSVIVTAIALGVESAL